MQQKALCWLACAWAENFTGAVIDYGSWPDQHREYFTLNDVKVTLADAVPGAGLEGQIFGGLEQLVGMLMGRTWLTDDGTPLRIGKLLIDASWGNSTDTVYQFCRQSVHQVSLLPSHGRYISAAAKPFEEWAKKPGDRVGPGWRIPGSRGQRPVRHGLYDSNFWKTFVHLRLGVAMGDPGCLSLWGREPRRHRMLAEHLTAETRERVTGTARTIDAWRLRPARDNHLLDCAVGCAVAASMLGVRLPNMEVTTGKAKPKLRLSDLQRVRR